MFLIRLSISSFRKSLLPCVIFANSFGQVASKTPDDNVLFSREGLLLNLFKTDPHLVFGILKSFFLLFIF